MFQEGASETWKITEADDVRAASSLQAPVWAFKPSDRVVSCRLSSLFMNVAAQREQSDEWMQCGGLSSVRDSPWCSDRLYPAS